MSTASTIFPSSEDLASAQRPREGKEMQITLFDWESTYLWNILEKNILFTTMIKTMNT